MGGVGSGRTRTTTWGNVESCVSLDVHDVMHRDPLAANRVQHWTWSSAQGQAIVALTVRVDVDCVWVSYGGSPADGQPVAIQERVALAIPACQWGAPRPCFLCPTCQRRVIKLYLVRNYFRCRRCHRLAYASQHETPSVRAFRRFAKHQRRLGRPPVIRGMPARPKSMWQRTQNALLGKAMSAKRELVTQLHARAQALETRMAKTR